MIDDIFIGVGSNIDPFENIKRAFSLLKREVAVKASSSFYQTPPFNKAGTQDYLNGIWRIGADITPKKLKRDVLHRIESKMGRSASEDPDAPRIIDLDLLLYGDLVSEDPLIPDPDIFERNFIIIPMMEIAAEDKIIPGTNLSLKNIAADMNRDNMTLHKALTDELKKDFEEIVKNEKRYSSC